MTDSIQRDLADAEARATVPFRLDCRDLSAQARLEVRAQFLISATLAVRHTAKALGRAPDAREVQLIRSAISKWVNTSFIPPIREREAKTIQ